MSKTSPEIHGILANERRLRSIEVLRRANGELPLNELADRIAEDEADNGDNSKNVRNSVYVSLVQNHIDQLVAHDIVEFDEDEKVIRLVSDPRPSRFIFETVTRYEFSWSEIYFGTAVLGLTVIIGATVGTPILSMISATTWSVISLLGVLLIALYRTLQQEASVLSDLGS